MTKFCISCQKIKDITEFYNKKNSPDKKQIYCKTCQKEKALQWQKENRQSALNIHKKFYRVHLERKLRYAKEKYYQLKEA